MIKITYFVHGTTTDNEKGIASGWLNPSLSDTGIQQAKELGMRMKMDRQAIMQRYV